MLSAQDVIPLSMRRNGTAGRRPPQGRLVIEGSSDLFRADRSRSLTPTTASALLAAADAGQLGEMLDLWQRMEDADSHLQGVLNTRRLGVTGLGWDIVPASDTDDSVDAGAASDAAEFINERLRDFDAFDAMLSHIAEGVGPGLAVSELEWAGNRLADIHTIAPVRLLMDLTEGRAIRVRTGEFLSDDVPARVGKFVVHTPHSKSGLPQRGSLLRGLTLLFIVKSYGLKDWATYTELFGMPVRTGFYPKDATSQEKTELLRMLEQLGTQATAVFKEGMLIELKNMDTRGQAPYEGVIRWVEQKVSIAVLGQTHATDTSGQTGTLATAKVHELIRQDLREADVQAEARTVRAHVFAPMIQYGFPVADAPLPFFVRRLPDVRDRQVELAIVEGATTRLGMSVTKDHAYDVLGIARPGDDVDKAELLSPPEPVAPGGFGGLGDLFSNGSGV